MPKTTHFLVMDRTTGETLAKLPLSFPIGDTIQRFQEAGHKDVHWTWLTEPEESYCPECGALGCCLS